MIVKCNKECWDSKRARHYVPGDQDDIDPLEPVAMYFDFPAGTKVYHKRDGIETTRISTGQARSAKEKKRYVSV